MSSPRSEAAKKFNLHSLADQLRGKVSSEDLAKIERFKLSDSMITTAITEIAKSVLDGNDVMAREKTDSLAFSLFLHYPEELHAIVEDFIRLLNEIIGDFDKPIVPESPTIAVQENSQDIAEGNGNFAFFVRKGRSLVGEDFLNIEGILTRDEKSYSSQERMKIIRDFHQYLMAWMDVIMDDIAKDNFVAKNKRLRTAGKWHPGSDKFIDNPQRVSQKDPLSLDDWQNELPEGIRSFFGEARKIVEDFATVSNQAKDVLEIIPASNTKASEEDIIKLVAKDGYSMDPEKIFHLVSGSTIENGKRKDVHNALFSELLNEILYILDKSYRGLSVSSRGKKIVVPIGFPNTNVDPNDMYQSVIGILRERIEDKKNVDPEIAAMSSDYIESQMKWAFQAAYDISWAYFQGLVYDKKAYKSSFSEGTNASTYHSRDENGIPAKTAYHLGETSKGKTPRVTDRRTYYFSPMEYIHLNAMVNYDDVHIGQTSADLQDYFENYLVGRYGSRENRNKSKEFLDALGQVPYKIYRNDQNQIDFDEIAKYFIVIEVKKEKTPFQSGGDKILVRRTPQINESIASVSQRRSTGVMRKEFLPLQISLYDALHRARLPQFDEESGASLYGWGETIQPDSIKENYAKYLSFEHKYFMQTIMTDKIFPEFNPISDKVEWSVKAAPQLSIMRSLVSFMQNMSGLSPSAAETTLKLLKSRLSSDLKGGNPSTLIFDAARAMVQVQETELGEKITNITKLKELNDNLFTYYSGSAAGGESIKLPQPNYDSNNNFLGFTYDKRRSMDFIYPRINERAFANIFVDWNQTPFYASNRAFIARSVLEESEAKFMASSDPKVKSAMKARAEKARFVLEIDQMFYTIMSQYISQFMYPRNGPEDMIADGDAETIVDMNKDSMLRQTITKDVIVHMPEDIATEVSLFTAYALQLARVTYESIAVIERSAGITPQSFESFLEHPLSEMKKDPMDPDTWGFSMSEIRSTLLLFYAQNGISSGSKAAGVALDWMAAAVTGQIDRFSKTMETLERIRKTRRGAGLLDTFGINPLSNQKK